MADFYVTDQTRHGITSRRRGAVVHVGARKVYGATGEPVGWAGFALCGVGRPDDACTTTRETTCKRCAKIVADDPCTATAEGPGGRFVPCERGGPHLTHINGASGLTWRTIERTRTDAP